MNLLWDIDLSDWLDCTTNTFAPGGLAKINDTSFALASNVRIQQEGEYDQFGYRLTTFDIDGNVLTDQTFYRPDLQYNIIEGMEKLDTGYAIWGNCTGTQSNGMECSPDVIQYVFRTDDLGTIQDIYFFEDNDLVWDGMGSLELLSDGNMLAMYAYNYEMDCDNWKIKTKPRAVMMNMQNLEPIWDFTYDIPEINDNWYLVMHSQDIVKATDNGYVGIFYLATAGNDVKSLVVKIDSSGQLVWYRFIQAPDNPEESYAERIYQTPDGGYVVGGMAFGSDNPMWLIKLDACGYEVESGCPAKVGLKEEGANATSLWPNPIKSTLNAKLSSQTNRIEITDMTRRVVFAENVFYPNQQWDLKALASGSYLFKAIDETGVNEVTKFLKE